MPLGATASPPIGYLSFCVRRPDDCRPAPSAVAAAQPPVMTAALAGDVAAPTAPRAASLLARDTRWRSPGAGRGTLMTQPGFSLAVLNTPAPSAGLGDGVRWWRQPAEVDAGVVASLATEAAAPPAPAAGLPDVATTVDAPPAPTASPAPLVLDGALLAKLNETNRRINYSFLAKPDVETFGDSDYWHLPLADGTGVGDCKDFVLEKRRALIGQGIPADALSIAIVRTREGEGHAVLLIATDQGEYVLDNLSPWAMPWRQVSYQWLKRQVPGQPLTWVSIGGFG